MDNITFFKTDYSGVGNKKHNHILYAVGTKYCLCTVDKDHTHEVRQKFATDAAFDEQGVEISPATNFEWEIMPAGKVLHSHYDYEVFEPELPRKSLKKDEEVLGVYDLLKVETDREELSRLLGNESIDYCDKNIQWPSSIKTKLNNEKRACLTLNSMKPKMNILEGHFRQNRKDIKVNPIENGDQLVADALNLTLKFITNECNYFEEENEIFHNTVVPGRGFFHTYIDRNKNWEGDIVIESFDWDGISMGAHKKNDGSDCEHASKGSWLSMAEIQNRFPLKADEIKKNYEAVQMGTFYSNDEGGEESSFSGFDPKEVIDVYKKQFLLVEQYQREYYTGHVVIDEETRIPKNADNWSTKDINRLRTIPGLYILSRTPHRIKVILVAGMVHIDSRYLDEDYKLFKDPEIPIFPAYCYRSGNDFTGKIEMLKDPQNEKNKHRSLMADYATKCLNGLTYVDASMFKTPSEMYNYTKMANTPGAVVVLKDASQKVPIREEGFRFPAGLAAMTQICEDEIKGIVNVPDAMAGVDQSREESGVAIFRKIKQSLVGNEILFDNFSLSKLRAFKYVLRLIPECWNTERFMRLLSHLNTKKDGVILGGKKMVDEEFEIPEGENPDDYIYKSAVAVILHNADLSRYDVTLSETEFTETTMLANLALVLNAQQHGLDVGPELINLFPLPQKSKDNINKHMSQMAESKNQLENKKVDNEVIKTKIAHPNEQQ